jgi:hypothetical protein
MSYTKTVWNDGAAPYMNATNLNHMEQGIADAHFPQVSADRRNQSVTLALTDAPRQRFDTTLTSNRTVTLPASGATNGARFRITRTGLGAFTLDVGGLKTIPASTAAFVDVAHDGTAWRLEAYGTL